MTTPLAAKCTKGFTPHDPVANTPASTKAKTVTEYMAATANWRTELYSGPTSGTLMTHSESIALFTKLGVKMTPELKSASVSMPFDGFSQEKTTRKK